MGRHPPVFLPRGLPNQLVAKPHLIEIKRLLRDHRPIMRLALKMILTRAPLDPHGGPETEEVAGSMPTEQPTVPPDGAVLFISLGCYLRNDCTNALHPSDRVAFCVRSQECSPNIKMNHNHGVATALLGLIRTIIFFHFDDSQFLAFWKHHTIDAFTLFTHGRE